MRIGNWVWDFHSEPESSILDIGFDGFVFKVVKEGESGQWDNILLEKKGLMGIVEEKESRRKIPNVAVCPDSKEI